MKARRAEPRASPGGLVHNSRRRRRTPCWANDSQDFNSPGSTILKTDHNRECLCYRDSGDLREQDMVNLQLRADDFEPLAVLVRPVGFDTEAVGNLPADVIDQSL